MFLHTIINTLPNILRYTLLCGAGLGCTFLVLANQNTESINDSSPINRVHSSQRDSIAVTIIQIFIVTFLSLVILENRISQRRIKPIEEVIFQDSVSSSVDTDKVNHTEDNAR